MLGKLLDRTKLVTILSAALVVALAGMASGDAGDPVVIGQENLGDNTSIEATSGGLGYALILKNEGAAALHVESANSGAAMEAFNGSGESAVIAVGNPGITASNDAFEGWPPNPAVVANSGQCTEFGFSPCSPVGQYGLALQTDGAVRFKQASGLATIFAGTSSKTVQLRIDLTATSKVLATANGPGGMVSYVGRNAANDRIVIHLTRKATSNVPVAWFVISGA
jgi:hypothetical protein